MRDRLIKLIKDSLNKHIGKSCLLAENIVDDLLSNGVIVPPCKVGDKVYVVDYTRGYAWIFECTVEEISHFECGTYYHLDWGLHIPRFKAFQEKCFGKTVFLTREEAEQALVASYTNVGGKEKGE